MVIQSLQWQAPRHQWSGIKGSCRLLHSLRNLAPPLQRRGAPREQIRLVFLHISACSIVVAVLASLGSRPNLLFPKVSRGPRSRLLCHGSGTPTFNGFNHNWTPVLIYSARTRVANNIARLMRLGRSVSYARFLAKSRFRPIPSPITESSSASSSRTKDPAFRTPCVLLFFSTVTTVAAIAHPGI